MSEIAPVFAVIGMLILIIFAMLPSSVPGVNWLLYAGVLCIAGGLLGTRSKK